MANRGTLFIISAPSGAGKTTLYKMALEGVDHLSPSVSYTTRPKRGTEIEGVDYCFVSKEDFDTMIADNEFIEWAEVHGNKYGTPKKGIHEKLDKGEDILFDIDVQGARNLKAQFPDAVLIFVLPPSFDILKERLNSRNTNETDDINVRMDNALQEVKAVKDFDYLIINNFLTKALKDLEAIIVAQRAKVNANSFDFDKFISY